jgi:hypothetical protein
LAITYHAGRRIQATSSDVAVISNRGTITTDGSYTVITFNSDGTFTPTSAFDVEWLVMAGGGAGGFSVGGGGGAGGYRTGTGHGVTAKNYAITVGAGGARTTTNGTVGANGSDSVFDTITSTGGGGGGCADAASAGHGGSGGGGAGYAYTTKGNGNTPSITPITGETTTVQGYDGGTGVASTTTGCGGGGGSSAVGGSGAGGTSGNGGAGTSSSITGSAVTRAGGGGSSHWNGSAGTGGSGGGTDGARGGASGTANAGDNTGSGGGGFTEVGGTPSNGAGAGGSGVVIVRFLTSGNTYSTSAGGKPTNVQEGSRLEETDTRTMYYYEEQVPDYDYPMTTDPRTNTFERDTTYGSITYDSTNDELLMAVDSGSGESTGSMTYIDLGSTLSSKFVLRFENSPTGSSSYATNAHNVVGISSVAPTTYGAISSTDWVGIRWYFGTQWNTANKEGIEPRIGENTSSNNHNNSSSVDRLYGKPNAGSNANGRFFHELVWDNGTLTYKVYDNANYTGTVLATAILSSSSNTQWVTGTPSNVTGLRYIVFNNGSDHYYGTYNQILDNIQIWDGVTVAATGNAWKELGT